MKDNFKNLQELVIQFQDENVCREYLAQRRWKDGKAICPYCGHTEAYIIENGKRYKCKNKECSKKYSVTVGTIFEDSNIPLSKWFIAIYIATSHKKGISSIQLSKDISVTQKTAWFMLHRIREMVMRKSFDKLVGVVEADESYYGGKESNKHTSKQTKGTQGRNTETKTPIFGLLERNGKIIVEPVSNVKGKTLKRKIKNNVTENSTICTDEWKSYNGLSKNYTHLKVEHGKGVFVVGIAHTNGLEGFWSLLKRGINGIQHSVSEKHLHRYCDEYSYRYNTKSVSETDRFDLTLQSSEGRLTYKNLIK